MKPKWQKLASLAHKYTHFGFSSLVQSLLPNDTLLRTYFLLKLDVIKTNSYLSETQKNNFQFNP